MAEQEEQDKARLYQAQQKRQAVARRARERKLRGNPAARRKLQQDYQPIIQASQERGRGGPPERR